MPLDRETEQILEQAVHCAFPDRSRALLREIGRWFGEWEGHSRVPSPARCNFCRRSPYQIRFSRELSREPPVNICDNCLRGWAERFNEHWGAEIPAKEMILADTARALRAGAGAADQAEALLHLLEAQAALDRDCTVRSGRCDHCHALEERPLVCSREGGFGVCARCLMDLQGDPGV